MSVPIPADDERKLCPKCGHSNRFSAKNCVNCGAPFYLVHTNGEVRKRCFNCGTFNRMNAKVCAQCGTTYPRLQLASKRRDGQKWCPQCGAPRRATAKVCTQCGFRFKQNAIKEPPIGQSDELAEAIRRIRKVDDSPLIQSEVMADPVTQRGTAGVNRKAPRPAADVAGEPAPYISPDELKRITSRPEPSRLETLVHFIRGLLGVDR